MSKPLAIPDGFKTFEGHETFCPDRTIVEFYRRPTDQHLGYHGIGLMLAKDRDRRGRPFWRMVKRPNPVHGFCPLEQGDYYRVLTFEEAGDFEFSYNYRNPYREEVQDDTTVDL